MDQSRLEILPRVWLDHRRAIYFEEHALLAIADLHLGYAWAQRYNGQMLPFGAGDGLVERIADLCAYYQPGRFAFLGDVVHEAVPVAKIVDDLQSIFDVLGRDCVAKLILGNHDKKLRSILPDKAIGLAPFLRLGGYLLLHGNQAPEGREGAVVIMGHEHPAISLGDGIKGAKFPCFLVSETVVILPAFSLWAAGTNIRAYAFMSAVAQRARFKKAVAICGEKLLPVPLN